MLNYISLGKLEQNYLSTSSFVWAVNVAPYDFSVSWFRIIQRVVYAVLFREKHWSLKGLNLI